MESKNSAWFHRTSSTAYCKTGSKKNKDHPVRSYLSFWVTSPQAPWSLTGGHGKMDTHCHKESTLNEADNKNMRKHSNSLDITNNSKGNPIVYNLSLDTARGWCGSRERNGTISLGSVRGHSIKLLKLQKNAWHFPKVCEATSVKYLAVLGRREL